MRNKLKTSLVYESKERRTVQVGKLNRHAFLVVWHRRLSDHELLSIADIDARRQDFGILSYESSHEVVDLFMGSALLLHRLSDLLDACLLTGELVSFDLADR